MREIILLLTPLPIEPETRVNLLFIVVEFPLPTSLIFDEIALVDVPIGPVIDPIAVLSVKHVMSLVMLLAFRIVPDAIPISEALLEISPIVRTVCPVVGAKPFGKTIDEMPVVFVAVCIVLYSFSVFQSIFEVSHEVVS